MDRTTRGQNQKCVHHIDNKLRWHQVATLPKPEDVGTSSCVRGSLGKPGVPTDPGGGEPLRRASRFALVSVVSQFEVSSWNWDRSCSTRQQMGTRHPCGSEDTLVCLKGLWQSGPQTLGTSPPASFRERVPTVEFNPNWAGRQKDRQREWPTNSSLLLTWKPWNRETGESTEQLRNSYF